MAKKSKSKINQLIGEYVELKKQERDIKQRKEELRDLILSAYNKGNTFEDTPIKVFSSITYNHKETLAHWRSLKKEVPMIHIPEHDEIDTVVLKAMAKKANLIKGAPKYSILDR